MKRYTQRQLKNLVALGAAVDVTDATDRNAIPCYYRKIGYSKGVYGLNGLLLQSDGGQLYAVCARTTAIFLF